MPPPEEKASEKLGDYIRRVRLAKKFSITKLAEMVSMSKQYLCDLEHGRRGERMEQHTVSRLAAALDIPAFEIADRLEKKLSDKELRKFADYHRVLRSNLRAQAALRQVSELREAAVRIRIALRTGKDSAKALQHLETTIEALDSTLAYKGLKPKRWAASEGPDAKYTAGRAS